MNFFITVALIQSLFANIEVPAAKQALMGFVNATHDAGVGTVHCAGQNVTFNDLAVLIYPVIQQSNPKANAAQVALKAMAAAYPCGSPT
jgi:hypothetical protein